MFLEFSGGTLRDHRLPAHHRFAMKKPEFSGGALRDHRLPAHHRFAMKKPGFPAVRCAITGYRLTIAPR